MAMDVVDCKVKGAEMQFVAIKRATGEALFTIDYTNNTANKRRMAFGAPYLGKMLPMDMAATGRQLERHPGW